MNDENEPERSEDDLPPFCWRRTLALLLVAWGVGGLMVWNSAPELPWPLTAGIAFFLGVIVVGWWVRIF